MRSVVRAVLTWRFVLALSVSILLWVRLTIVQNPDREDPYPTGIPVEVRGLGPTLVVANDVGTVRVRILAPEESWRQLQASSFRATVDLTGLPAGLHQRGVMVECSDPDVRLVRQEPVIATVRVEEIRSAEVPVHANLIGDVPFGYRMVGTPLVEPDGLMVVGPASAVERVTEAIVTVRMDELRSTAERSIKPEPRGVSGAVPGVRLDPQAVSVTVNVEQIAASKSVPVVATIKGQPANGYAMASVTVDPPTVQVVGDPAQLERLSTLATQDLDVSGASADLTRSVPVVRPRGISTVGEEPITVRVRVSALPGQQARSVAVVPTELMLGIAAVVDPPTVTVVLSGTQPSLLRLGGGDVEAAVDLTALGPGTFLLPVTATAVDGVRVERVEPDRVAVVLSAPFTPTPSVP